jgi:hypothetical protein
MKRGSESGTVFGSSGTGTDLAHGFDRSAIARILVTAAVVVGSVAGCGGPRIPAPPRPLHIADPEQAVAAYYRRLNAEDLEGVLALMTPEPTLAEPFTSGDGSTTIHSGYRDVATFFAQSFRTRDDQVVPEFIRAEGASNVEVGWSMHGSDGTGMSGQSHIELSHGLISRIVIERRD